jgi:hypothetical protein
MDYLCPDCYKKHVGPTPDKHTDGRMVVPMAPWEKGSE